MEKVFFLALDGLSWNLINELINNGELKNIKKMIDSGASATLKAEGFLSSPKIFCSIFTGKKVENHGIRDFYSKEEDLCSDQIWDILHEKGLKIGIYRPLSVWTPKEFAGFCIPNPLLLKKKTYPENLQFIADIDIKARSEEYSIKFLIKIFWNLVKFRFPFTSLVKLVIKGIKLFFRKGLEERMHLLKEIELIMHTELYYKLIKKNDLDFSVFFDYSFDTLSHIYWREQDSKEDFKEVLPTAYKIVDRFVGNINRKMNKADGHLILCSDHGFKLIEKKGRKNFQSINVLYLLRELGFYYDVYGVYMFMSVIFRARPDSNRPLMEFKDALANITVEDEPLFNIKSYEKKLIVRINEFFGENKDLQARLPNGKTLSLDSFIDFNPGHTGKHSEDFGVFIISGPKIKEGIKLGDVQPYDITPTILSLFEVSVSDEMDGRALKEVFKYR